MSVASIYKKFDGLCVYCGVAVKLTGTRADKRQMATRDHFVPLSAGGSKGVGNQVLACRGCNCDKGQLDPRTIVQVWHRLDRDDLVNFVRRLDEAASALAAVEARTAETAADAKAGLVIKMTARPIPPIRRYCLL